MNLLALPVELLERIVGFLDKPAWVCRLELVCLDLLHVVRERCDVSVLALHIPFPPLSPASNFTAGLYIFIQKMSVARAVNMIVRL